MRRTVIDQESQNATMSRLWQNLIKPESVFTFVILVYLYFVSERVITDFWSDEIYTLKHFVLVPLATTVHDYHVPNNHVFFSIILNVWAKVLGKETLHDVFLSPSAFRSLSLVFSISSIWLVYRVGCRIGDKWLGVMVASVLAFSISFFEFGIQLRGYSLSICLVSALILTSLNLIRSPTITRFIGIAFLSGMLGYTIPLNYYFLLSLLIVVGLKLVVLSVGAIDRKKGVPEEKVGCFLLVCGVSIGICFSLLSYLPIFSEVFFNTYVEKKGIDFVRSVKLSLMVLNDFLSRRSGLLVICLAGFFWFVRGRKPRAFGDIVLLSGLLIMPFIISALRGDGAPPRAFVNLIPVFSIVSGYLAYSVLRELGATRLLIVAFVLIGALESRYEHNRLESLVLANLERTRGPSRPQELNYGYYSYGYRPLTEINKFKRKREKDLPLVLGDAEPNGLAEYLNAFGETFIPTGLSIPDVDGRPWEGPSLTELAIQHPDGFYFVTRFYNRLYRSLVEQNLAIEITPISNQASFHNFFLIEPIP